MRFSLVCVCVSLASFSAAQFGAPDGNPFAPPAATVHYAPDRICDLQHIRVDLMVDYANLGFTGHVVNTMVALRDTGEPLHLMAGPKLQISKVMVDGHSTSFERKGRDLTLHTSPVRKGQRLVVTIDYSAKGNTVSEGGFHWIVRKNQGENHVGFTTQGETGTNSDWAPTWDYPNDFTTSETHCTVPAAWTVIGNGVLKSNQLSADRKTRTFYWALDIPHATYLLSLVGGPFDVNTDRWRGIPLMYVTPKGEGKYAAYTFSGTKDMLSFYSDTLGYAYPWPKYAQDAMFDFGGGMENVSATTMGEDTLTEPREGFRNGDSLISHEMAHQWFGDTVTCKDWGDIWLNESFATFMQMLYFEHSRGKNGYDEEVDQNVQQYLAEARRYKRPISTKLYQDPDAMFDSHTYPKGGVVLHTLRRQLGDANFFAGLKLYLHRYEHTPVQTSELCRSFTEASGINCEPFFDDWILKPGHPVLDYQWSLDAGGKSVTLAVKQIQNREDGTPIYTIPAKVVLITGGRVTRAEVTLSSASNRFTIPVQSRPDAVILDGDHDFLREIPELHWSHDELIAILKYGPEGGDRTEAIRRILKSNPTDADYHAIAEAVQADRSEFPSFTTLIPLINVVREDWRPMLEELLTHPNYLRRTQAVQCLSKFPATPETSSRLRSMINDHEAIGAVSNAIRALAGWDAKGNVDVFTKALKIPSRNNRIARAAQDALNKAKQ